MKNTTYRDLDLMAALTATTALLLLVLPGWQSPVRAFLGLFLVLFAPGYALYHAIFLRPQHRLEQLVLSLVLSMIVTAAFGLLLNYTPWGLTAQALGLTLGGFTLGVLGFIAWRRGRINTESIAMPRPMLLSVAAGLVLLSGLGWGASQRLQIERNTEFTLLGAKGQLAEYPSVVTAGSRLPVTVAVRNLEGRPVQYRVRAGFGSDRFAPVSLDAANGQERSLKLEAVAPAAPGRYTLRLDLYRDTDTRPHRQLALTVTVK